MTEFTKRVVSIFAVCFVVAWPFQATTVVTVPTYVVGGKAIAFDLDVIVWGADGRFTRPTRFEELEAEIQSLVADRVAAAGYEFEVDVDHWHEADRAFYLRTGQPHYRIFADLKIRPIFSSDGGEIAFAFDLEASLFAELLQPDSWIERFSDRRLGGAVPSEFSVRVLEHMSKLLDMIFSSGNSYTPFKETRTLLEGRYSVDLVGWGFEHFREYLLGEAQGDTRVDLFREPRSENLLPVASFGVAGRPAKISISDEARYVVIEGSVYGGLHPRRTYEIRRVDGTLIRQFSTDDLLTEQDRRRLPRVPATRIDSERQLLVVEIPTCYPGGSHRGFHMDCSEGDHVDVLVDLETGRLKQAKRDLLPYIGGQFKISGLDEDLILERPNRVRCESDRDRQDILAAPRVPFDEAWVQTLAMPKYTRIAEKARIEGGVELTLLVDPSGEVDCVMVTKGLPMGLAEVSVEAALDWRFEPDPSWDGPRQVRVVLEASLGVRYPSVD